MNIQFLCECLNAVGSLSIQDVLNNIANANVCTITQCFETQESAFGVTTTASQTKQINVLFYALMSYMMTIALFIKINRKKGQGKNRAVLANSLRHHT